LRVLRQKDEGRENADEDFDEFVEQLEAEKKGREPVFREARDRWMSLPGRAPPPIVVNLPPRRGG
jgi:hypothetical protein